MSEIQSLEYRISEMLRNDLDKTRREIRNIVAQGDYALDNIVPDIMTAVERLLVAKYLSEKIQTTG